MKILFIALPYPEHVLPTLNVVASLVSRGHIVDYLLTPVWHSAVESAGALLIPYDQQKSAKSMLRSAYLAARKIGRDYDVIVYDHLFFLGKGLGEELGKQAVRLYCGVALNKEIMQKLLQGKGFAKGFRKKIFRTLWTRQVARGTSSEARDWTEEVLVHDTGRNIAFVAEWFQPQRDTFAKESLCFVGPCASPPSSVPMPVRPVKRLLPLIYISLGGSNNKQTEFYRRCLAAFKRQEVNVLLAVGNDVSIQSLGIIPPNCHVFHHVPQYAVLHKCSLFITDGSMESVNEGLSQGVPMLVLPVTASQCVNAKCVVELGVGVQLGMKGLSAEILQKSACALLDDESVRVRALAAKQKLEGVNGSRVGAELIVEGITKPL